MMGLMHPFWMAALAALMIPLLIHLWSRRKGKKIRVGSTLLLAAARRTASSSININQYLLLALRLILLVLLALLLAGPFIHIHNGAAHPEKWILIQDGIPAIYKKDKKLLDSLLGKGFIAHRFNAGFSSIDSFGHVFPAGPVSLWPLLLQLDQLPASPAEVWLFTADRLSYFTGTRPSIHLKLHWQTLASADSINRSLESSWLTVTDSIRQRWSYTSPEGTWVKEVLSERNAAATGSISSPASSMTARTGPVETEATHTSSENTSSANTTKARTRMANTAAAPADTAVFHLAVFYDQDKSKDAAYVKAAISAVTSVTERRISVSQQSLSRGSSVLNTGSGPLNGIIWLSDSPLPEKFTGSSSPSCMYFILKYQHTSALKKVHARFRMAGEIPDSGNAAQERISALYPLLIHESGISKIFTENREGSGYPVWETLAGDPVLSLDQPEESLPLQGDSSGFADKGQLTGNKTPANRNYDSPLLYRFYSRFDPAWNDLVWTEAFPELFQQLLAGSQSRHSVPDNRRIDPAQLLPVRLPPVSPSFHSNRLKTLVFEPYLWIFLLLVFIAERWLSND